MVYSIVVPYDLYELYDLEKVPELYNGRVELHEFCVLGCSLFSAGVYGVGLKQLTKILYVICYVLCYFEL